MKLIASGETNSAARVRSPSFSRSSSSTRMTILPSRMSAMAFSIFESGIPSPPFSRITVIFQKIQRDAAPAAFEALEDVFTDDVGFEVDPRPRPQDPKGRSFEGDRDDGQFDSVPADGTDRKADAVDGHRPLVNQELHYRRIGLDMEYPGFPQWADFPDRARTVHVAVDDVPPEPSREGERALQVDLRPGAHPAERRLRERLLRGVRGERPRPSPRHGQADPRHGDGISLRDRVHRQVRRHRDRRPRPQRRQGGDRPHILDDPGEHQRSSVPSIMPSAGTGSAVSSRSGPTRRTEVKARRGPEVGDRLAQPDTARVPSPRSRGATKTTYRSIAPRAASRSTRPPAPRTARTSRSGTPFGQTMITSPPGSRKSLPGASSAGRDVRITLRGSCPPGTRAVRSGSSRRAVSPPTSTASAPERIRCTRRRAASPVIHRESPAAAAIWPSRETASFNVTNGFPETTHRQNPRLSSRASASINPRCTTRPASRSRLSPRPETAGLGSSIANATRVISDARIAAVHGPVRPRWSHGSRVTYRSAPRAELPACRSASISAWGSPAAR